MQPLQRRTAGWISVSSCTLSPGLLAGALGWGAGCCAGCAAFVPRTSPIARRATDAADGAAAFVYVRPADVGSVAAARHVPGVRRIAAMSPRPPPPARAAALFDQGDLRGGNKTRLKGKGDGGCERRG